MKRNGYSGVFFGISFGFLFLASQSAFGMHAVHCAHSPAGEAGLSYRSLHRVEHFLSHIFPARQMLRYAREERDRGVTIGSGRSVTYHVVSQEGLRFVLAAYTLEGASPVHVLAVYRMERGGPNQVWRSRPWEGSFSDLRFTSVKSQGRNIVLFQEGGELSDGGRDAFGLSSIFTFLNEPDALFLRDLTPELPWLRARTRFPLRVLYAQRVSMETETSEIVLRASDEEYNRSLSERVRPQRAWKYNASRGTFERMKSVPAATEADNGK